MSLRKYIEINELHRGSSLYLLPSLHINMPLVYKYLHTADFRFINAATAAVIRLLKNWF